MSTNNDRKDGMAIEDKEQKHIAHMSTKWHGKEVCSTITQSTKTHFQNSELDYESSKFFPITPKKKLISESPFSM